MSADQPASPVPFVQESTSMCPHCADPYTITWDEHKRACPILSPKESQ